MSKCYFPGFDKLFHFFVNGAKTFAEMKICRISGKTQTGWLPLSYNEFIAVLLRYTCTCFSRFSNIALNLINNEAISRQ